MTVENIILNPRSVATEAEIKSSRIYRREISLLVQLPDKIEGLTSADLEDVKNALSEVRIIEYDSGRPGPLVVVTEGMHGEETIGNFKNTVEDLDERLQPQVLNITTGSLVLVPNLNSRGCQAKTRYVFPDEEGTNLNNIFHLFQGGSTSEFMGLATRTHTPKTAIYGWLLMKYFTDKAHQHRENYGRQRPVFLFDLHREERAIPQLSIDRFDNDPKLLAGLINGVRSLEIPSILSYDPQIWKKLGYDQLLSTAAIRNGMLGYTIEEGRTYHPDINSYKYITIAIMRFLRKLNVLSGPQEIWKEFDQLWRQLSVISPLRKTYALWHKQHDKGELYMLYDQSVGFESKSGEALSSKEFLKQLASKPDWDGIISVEVLDAIRGTSGENTSIHIADVSLGRQEANLQGKIEGNIDYYLTIPHFAQNHYLISLHESPKDLAQDGVVYFAFTPIKRGTKIVGVRLIRIDGSTNKDIIILGPKHLKHLIEKSKLEIDLSELDVVCAAPDKLWEGRLQKGKVLLFPRKKQVFP